MDYNIEINDLIKVKKDGSLSDVVTEVKYTLHCTASDAGSDVYSSHHFNSILEHEIAPATGSNFTNFSDLTVGKVNAWITGSVGWAGKLENAENLTSQSVWPEESNGLPW